MSRTGGEQTKERILKVAENLFAERGFNGTSVDMIAKQTGVNKALIYYHFKDKNDIIISLFRSIIDELYDYRERSADPAEEAGDPLNKIREEVEFCVKRKKILSVLLMESLKSHDRNHYLFQCAEIVINYELKAFLGTKNCLRNKPSPEKQQLLVHEFFTGFIPIITFVVLRDKWSDYFNCDDQKLMDYFLDAFEKSHLASCYGPKQGLGRV